MSKKYIIFTIIVLSLAALLFLYEFLSFTLGVREDSMRSLLAKKEYFKQIYFRGKITQKEACYKCSKFKWDITLRIDTINRPVSSNIMDNIYPPYYHFDGDSLLHIKIPLSIYNNVNLEDVLTKEHGSLDMKINSIVTYQLLSKDQEMWLYDDNQTY